jgi:uncharacterized protein
MVRGFFDNGGKRAYLAGTVDALAGVDEIDLICPEPGDNDAAIAQCERRADRIAVLSLPAGLAGVDQVLAARPGGTSGFAAVHHPWVRAGGELTPPGGHVAGAYASGTNEVRGLDDAPLERSLSDREVATLVEGRVNPLRGRRVESGLTLDPDPERNYVNVRRLLIFLERSIDRGLRWVAFEPNGEPLWAAVRETVSDFLATRDEPFFVRCDRTTMTQDDLDNGRLVCVIGVAPLRPAEYVIIRIGQWTADAHS